MLTFVPTFVNFWTDVPDLGDWGLTLMRCGLTLDLLCTDVDPTLKLCKDFVATLSQLEDDFGLTLFDRL